MARSRVFKEVKRFGARPRGDVGRLVDLRPLTCTLAHVSGRLFKKGCGGRGGSCGGSGLEAPSAPRRGF